MADPATLSPKDAEKAKFVETSNGDVAVRVVSEDFKIENPNISVELDHTEDSVEARQTTHDNLNANANIQVANADVSGGNPVPVSFSGDVEVVQPTHDDLNCNANMQIGNVDVSGSNPIPVNVTTATAAVFTAKFGRNTDIDSGLREDLIEWGGVWTPLTSAATASITSDSANDTSGGTGCQTLVIEGLVDNAGSWDEDTETVTMNGLTGVTTTKSWIRIHRMYISAVGSTGLNEGNITATISSTTQAYIGASLGQTMQAFYTVPSGKVGKLQDVYGSLTARPSSSGVKEGNLFLSIRLDGSGFRNQLDVGLNSRAGAFNKEFVQFVSYAAKTDIKLSFEANNNNCNVSGGFTVVLEDE